MHSHEPEPLREKPLDSPLTMRENYIEGTSNRKPLFVIGEESTTSPPKPTKDMPLFGSMQPGLSFKNAVVQSGRAQSEVKSQDTSRNGNPGDLTVKFGELRTPLPPRVQSAPPALEDTFPRESTNANSLTLNSNLRNSTDSSPTSPPDAGLIKAPQEMSQERPRDEPLPADALRHRPLENTARVYKNNRFNQTYPYPFYAGPYYDYGAMTSMYQNRPAPMTSNPTPNTNFSLPKSSKKIQIVDPNTMKEVELVDIPKITPQSTQDRPQEEGISLPVNPTNVMLPSRKPVVLVDPRSNREVDLSSWARNTEKLANILNEIDEEELFKGDDEDDDEDDDSCTESADGSLKDELEEDFMQFEFPVILTRNLKLDVYYPPSFAQFEFPPEGEPLKYSNEFMLQFAQFCKGEAKDIASVSFPKALPTANKEYAHDRASGRRDRKGRVHGSDRGRRRDHVNVEDTILSNRAAEAWKRASAMVLDEDLALLREIKTLLNKLTEANFETIQRQIIDKGVLKSGLTTGIIDLFFDKAVEEPRYAPLYAQLCRRIWSFEVENLRTEFPDEPYESLGKKSIFRKSLLTKCQVEYDTKRAYSRKRLELLRAERLEPEVIRISPEAAAADAKKVSGELTEEDYELLKMKRRVLGNMRFIGELFLVGLIRGNIMHQVIQELLKDYLDPEEEEVESVCRLFATIGAYLDTKEAAVQWREYEERLKSLAHNPKLPTRIRFMVMDLLELRGNGWNNSVSNGKRGGGTTNRRASENSGSLDARSGEPVRYSTTGKKDDVRPIKQSPSQHLQGSLGAENRPKQIHTRSTLPKKSSVDLMETKDQDTNDSKSAPITEPSSSISVVNAIFEETVQQKNYEDIVETFRPFNENQRMLATKALIDYATQKGKNHVKHLAQNVFPRLVSDQVLDKAVAQKGFVSSFESLDDLIVDVPNAAEFAGILGATLLDVALANLSTFINLFQDLCERSPSLMGKVLWYILSYSQLDMDVKKESIRALDSTIKENVLCQNSARALAEKLGLLNILND